MSDEPPPRSPSRRALLHGGLAVASGAVLGAGAASGVAAARWPQAQPLPAITPNEQLMIEHGVLKRLLLCFRTLGPLLRSTDPASTSVGGATQAAAMLVSSTGIIRSFIEDFHEAAEEAYVFPRLLKAGQQQELVQTLLTQHDRGRHLTAALAAAAADGLTDPAARTTTANNLATFVRMYEPHEAWEDTVIFPVFRELTPDATWSALAERFAQEQQRMFGSNYIADFLNQVMVIEEKLGIGNPASFTP